MASPAPSVSKLEPEAVHRAAAFLKPPEAESHLHAHAVRAAGRKRGLSCGFQQQGSLRHNGLVDLENWQQRGEITLHAGCFAIYAMRTYPSCTCSDMQGLPPVAAQILGIGQVSSFHKCMIHCRIYHEEDDGTTYALPTGTSGLYLGPRSPTLLSQKGRTDGRKEGRGQS